MVKHFLLPIGFLLFSFQVVLGQKPAETLNEHEESYEWRIRQDYLYEVYIPKDMGDAFIQLNKLIDEESRKKFMSLSEEDAYDRLFFSFGRWIIHNWGFYGGSRFSHYLRELGVYHPEDMARFVILTYHRNLHRNPLNVKELIDEINAGKEKAIEQKLKEGEVIYEETRKRDPKDGDGS
ncbi:MAG: hypothetical protein GYB31_05335 [Bacteroidetes bacterium]|nr:hypothetical protein [Bacteroidota bacterium]